MIQIKFALDLDPNLFLMLKDNVFCLGLPISSLFTYWYSFFFVIFSADLFLLIA